MVTRSLIVRHEPYSQSAAFIGSQYSNTSNKYQPDGTVLRNPDGTPQKKVVKGWTFNSLCKAEFAGGNDIYFGIRSAASESIESQIQGTSSAGQWSRSAFQGQPFYRSLHAPRHAGATPGPGTAPMIPTPVGDGVEMWMTPIGDSGYYITVTFNFIEAARQKNTEDYQRARKLMDGILQSVVIQKK